MGSHNFLRKYGPWAIITGASSGLGAELAEQLAKLGLHLVLVARREDRLRELAERLEREQGISTRVIALDLSDSSAPAVLLGKTQDLEVGLLVNNAGYARTGGLLDSSLEEEQALYRVNCELPLQLAMAFGKRMVERGHGGIMFVSSSVAYTSVPYWTHYSAAKAYTLRLGEGLYVELKEKGVDVLAVCPGGMKTGFQTAAGISNFGASAVKPVASCAIKALGQRPSVVPGLLNRAAFKLLPNILPARVSLFLYGLMMKKLSAAGKAVQNHK